MIHIISVYISIYVYKCTPKKKWWWPFLGPVDSVDLATTPGGFGLDLVKPSVTCTARSARLVWRTSLRPQTFAHWFHHLHPHEQGSALPWPLCHPSFLEFWKCSDTRICGPNWLAIWMSSVDLLDRPWRCEWPKCIHSSALFAETRSWVQSSLSIAGSISTGDQQTQLVTRLPTGLSIPHIKNYFTSCDPHHDI